MNAVVSFAVADLTRVLPRGVKVLRSTGTAHVEGLAVNRIVEMPSARRSFFMVYFKTDAEVSAKVGGAASALTARPDRAAAQFGREARRPG